jgi:heme/copper-type cytochrome/quinol oxidase subunit 1
MITKLMPRRIPDFPESYAGWNVVSSFGSLVSVIATIIFAYIIFDIFAPGKNPRSRGLDITNKPSDIEIKNNP